ncbi:hypothetical protein LFT48_01845 [Arthrobacter sp. FW305-123]|nr:hypothetical protein LFT48_01845 [Arthrobacter sp. FW305-123]
MEDPRRTARTLIQHGTIDLEDLWIRYWSHGGNAPVFELDAYVFEVQERHPFELRILSWALEDLGIDAPL